MIIQITEQKHISTYYNLTSEQDKKDLKRALKFMKSLKKDELKNFSINLFEGVEPDMTIQKAEIYLQ